MDVLNDGGVDRIERITHDLGSTINSLVVGLQTKKLVFVASDDAQIRPLQ